MSTILDHEIEVDVDVSDVQIPEIDYDDDYLGPEIDNIDLDTIPVIAPELADSIKFRIRRRYPHVWSSKNLIEMWNARERIRKVIKETVKSDVADGGLSGINGHPKFIIKGVCLSEIARGVNMSVAEVSRIFSRKRRPSLSTAQKIAGFIGKRLRRKFIVDDLLTLIEEVNTEEAA